ncbi:hypothetical protein BDV96DRAFT_576295 [Lophiotrema nucula]|uniref:Uncharacterized protein n=1 Tax=Lophiotrema nucula TaxID=690887 RepID=A0A6A5Z9F2_9PLEO|nr:hypothetical protein BDV96DRAFT_576295 [Lophiotrema nucula]
MPVTTRRRSRIEASSREASPTDAETRHHFESPPSRPKSRNSPIPAQDEDRMEIDEPSAALLRSGSDGSIQPPPTTVSVTEVTTIVTRSTLSETESSDEDAEPINPSQSRLERLFSKEDERPIHPSPNHDNDSDHESDAETQSSSEEGRATSEDSDRAPSTHPSPTPPPRRISTPLSDPTRRLSAAYLPAISLLAATTTGPPAYSPVEATFPRPAPSLDRPKVTYICGSSRPMEIEVREKRGNIRIVASGQYETCGAEVKIAVGREGVRDPMRCRECGGRLLYKTRTKRMMQYECR